MSAKTTLVKEIIKEIAPHWLKLTPQERILLNINHDPDPELAEEREQIRKELLKRLGIELKDGKTTNFYDSNTMNFHLIEIYGAEFPWGWFMWNEHNLNSRGLKSYNRSLYEIDREESLYQHRAIQEADALSKEGGGLGQKEFVYDVPGVYYWLRTRKLDDDKITYVNVVSLHGWICDEIEAAMADYMQKRYNWEFVPGPNNGKVMGGDSGDQFTVLDITPQPADPSLADEFAIAYKISHKYESPEGYEQIKKEVLDKGIKGCLLIEDDNSNRSAPNEKNETLIVADVDTLKDIRPETFYSDIAQIELTRKIDLDQVKAIIDTKVKELINEIEALRERTPKKRAISCSSDQSRKMPK